MLLYGVHVLPQGLLPLCIFEPRYRAMLSTALEKDRVIAIGTLLSGWEDESDTNIHPFSTAAVIRASVTQPDGTSHLVLQGTERIRFLDWVQQEPFRIAQISAVEPRFEDLHAGDDLEAAEELIARILRLLPKNEEGHKIGAALRAFKEPGDIVDFIATTLMPADDFRLPLVGMSAVGDRLSFVSEWVKDLAGA